MFNGLSISHLCSSIIDLIVAAEVDCYSDAVSCATIFPEKAMIWIIGFIGN